MGEVKVSFVCGLGLEGRDGLSFRPKGDVEESLWIHLLSAALLC